MKGYRTIILNLVTALLAGSAMLTDGGLVSSEILLWVNVVLNTVLRFFTDTSFGEKI